MTVPSIVRKLYHNHLLIVCLYIFDMMIAPILISGCDNISILQVLAVFGTDINYITSYFHPAHIEKVIIIEDDTDARKMAFLHWK